MDKEHQRMTNSNNQSSDGVYVFYVKIDPDRTNRSHKEKVLSPRCEHDYLAGTVVCVEPSSSKHTPQVT